MANAEQSDLKPVLNACNLAACCIHCPFLHFDGFSQLLQQRFQLHPDKLPSSGSNTGLAHQACEGHCPSDCLMAMSPSVLVLLRAHECASNTPWSGWLQSHGREVDEEGWNSSGADSEGVQRSAHSTPHAGAAAPGAFATCQLDSELQVASRSRSALIPRRLKQVRSRFKKFAAHA